MTILHQNQIINTPKPVKIFQEGASATLLHDIPITDECKESIATLIELIELGKSIPSKYYSDNADEKDELLELHGIMHLKLPDNRRLYVVQTDTAVIFLIVSDHRYLDRTTGSTSSRTKPLTGRFADALKPKTFQVDQKPVPKKLTNKPKDKK